MGSLLKIGVFFFGGLDFSKNYPKAITYYKSKDLAAYEV